MISVGRLQLKYTLVNEIKLVAFSICCWTMHNLIMMYVCTFIQSNIYLDMPTNIQASQEQMSATLKPRLGQEHGKQQANRKLSNQNKR